MWTPWKRHANRQGVGRIVVAVMFPGLEVIARDPSARVEPYPASHGTEDECSDEAELGSDEPPECAAAEEAEECEESIHEDSECAKVVTSR